MMNEHEEAFATAFIVREKRARYLQLLANSKRRRKILDRLNHALDLDYRFATKISSVDVIETLLVQRGAKETCHIVADSSKLDGQELPLRDAVDFAMIHPWGLILSCLPGRLAFYKSEDIGDRYILERRSQ